MDSATVSSTSNSRAGTVVILSLACAATLTMGISTGGMGTVLNDFALHTGSPLEAVGILFTMFSSGALVTQLLGGMATDRFGARPVILYGSFAYGVGIIACGIAPSLLLLQLSGLVTGAGFGALGIGTALMVTETFPEQRVRYTNLTNLFFATGAMIGPLIGGVCLRLLNTAVPLLWASGIISFVILLVVAVRLNAAFPGNPIILSSEIVEKTPASSLPAGRFAAFTVYKSAALWICGMVLLLYSGLEIGMSGWSPTYLERTTPLHADTAALVVTGFYLMLTVGRVITTVIGTHYPPRLILTTACAGSLVGVVLLLTGYGNLPLTITAILLMGFCFGPVYPTMFALVIGTFRTAPGKAGSLVAAVSSLGGSLLVPLQGIVLERAGTAASPVYLMVLVLVMFGLYGLAGRLLPQPVAVQSNF